MKAIGLNIKRVIDVAGGVAALLFMICLVYVQHRSTHSGIADYTRIPVAVQAYIASLKSQGSTIPESVTLQELNKRGLLPADYIASFDGPVTISLRADETQPQEALIRVRLPDGNETVVLGDGSVQQVHKTRIDR